jgi:hypothetical protein
MLTMDMDRRRLRAPAARAALAFAFVASLPSCAVPLKVRTGLGFSSNPAQAPGGDGEGRAGARLDAWGSLDDADPFKVEASARGATFADGGPGFIKSYLEGRFAGSVPFVSYAATRLVEPHGPDLVGLTPRVAQGISAKAVFYTFDLTDLDFSESSLAGLDSRTRSHAVMVPFTMRAWLHGGSTVLFYLHSWHECESAGVTDYQSETGMFILSLGGPGGAPTGFDPSMAGWTAAASPGRGGALSAGLGWRRMGGFDGPVADPSGEVSSFAGFLAASAGPFAVALRRMPGPSFVSNYQVDTSAELAFAAGAGRWLARARVGRDEADRSWGADVVLWKASAGIEMRLARDWSLGLDVEWRERSSTAPGEGYEVFTAFLGVTWKPSKAGPYD